MSADRMPSDHALPTSGARRLIRQLLAERAAAQATSLEVNATYMDDLETDLQAARSAYEGLVVTEIATFRGELLGRQVG
jgi:hypothetical protein